MNKVILMGRLTADPELRQTQSGIPSCRIRIAVNRQFVDKTTGERQADFFSCTAWRQTAEFINRYFRKGSMIMIEGRLTTGSYQDRNHPDVTHYTTDITIENVEFTGSKAETGTNGGNNGNYQNNGGYNNYNGNNYDNNYQSAPPAQSASPQSNYNDSMSYGNSSDYEEIISDGDVPF